MQPDRDTFVVDNEGEVLTYPIVYWGPRHEQLVAWVEAHGIEPSCVAIPSRATIRDGMLTLELYALNEDGQRYSDEPEGPAARTTRTVPLVMEPPSGWVKRVGPVLGGDRIRSRRSRSMQPDMDQMMAELRARLDADERLAHEATGRIWRVDNEEYPEQIRDENHTSVVAYVGGEARVFDSTADALHIARHDPARVLRQVAAHRAILDEHERTDCRGHPDAWMKCGPGVCQIECWGCGRDWPCPTVRHLAEAYADGDGNDEDGRPA